MEFGSAVNANCVSCDEKCLHNVIYAGKSIVHLRCSECTAVNAFAFEEPKGKKKKTPPKKGEHLDHAALMNKRGSKSIKAYSAAESFSDGQYLDHPKFGEGYVLAVSSPPTKMRVLFEDSRRNLACGPDSASGAQRAKALNHELAKPSKASPRPRARVVKVTKKESATSLPSDEPVKCPKCGQVVHPYNMRRDSKRRIVGCMYCNRR